MNGMDSKFKLKLKKLQNNLKNWGIYNLNSVLNSRVLRILASQNRFLSLYDKIFNIRRVVIISFSLISKFNKSKIFSINIYMLSNLDKKYYRKNIDPNILVFTHPFWSGAYNLCLSQNQNTINPLYT